MTLRPRPGGTAPAVQRLAGPPDDLPRWACRDGGNGAPCLGAVRYIRIIATGRITVVPVADGYRRRTGRVLAGHRHWRIGLSYIRLSYIGLTYIGLRYVRLRRIRRRISAIGIVVGRINAVTIGVRVVAIRIRFHETGNAPAQAQAQAQAEPPSAAAAVPATAMSATALAAMVLGKRRMRRCQKNQRRRDKSQVHETPPLPLS